MTTKAKSRLRWVAVQMSDETIRKLAESQDAELAGIGREFWRLKHGEKIDEPSLLQAPGDPGERT